MEYGVGGGRSQMGNVKATTASEAAATPFFGVFGAYAPESNPWTIPSVRDYMHYFYAQTINYLRSQGVRQHSSFFPGVCEGGAETHLQVLRETWECSASSSNLC